jgi:hypothetical protein
VEDGGATHGVGPTGDDAPGARAHTAFAPLGEVERGGEVAVGATEETLGECGVRQLGERGGEEFVVAGQGVKGSRVFETVEQDLDGSGPIRVGAVVGRGEGPDGQGEEVGEVGGRRIDRDPGVAARRRVAPVTFRVAPRGARPMPDIGERDGLAGLELLPFGFAVYRSAQAVAGTIEGRGDVELGLMFDIVLTEDVVEGALARCELPPVGLACRRTSTSPPCWSSASSRSTRARFGNTLTRKRRGSSRAAESKDDFEA